MPTCSAGWGAAGGGRAECAGCSMTDDDLRDIATAHGLTLYRRAGGERGWHDMREGALLAFARAVERLALERAAALCDTAAEASGNHPRAGVALACAGAIRNLMTETRNG